MSVHDEYFSKPRGYRMVAITRPIFSRTGIWAVLVALPYAWVPWLFDWMCCECAECDRNCPTWPDRKGRGLWHWRPV